METIELIKRVADNKTGWKLKKITNNKYHIVNDKYNFYYKVANDFISKLKKHNAKNKI